MDYLDLLEWSYQVEREEEGRGPRSRLQFLAQHVFDFTTYESAADELFARKAVEVCEALTNRTTFDYIGSNDGRIWYLLMCNMPFFAARIEWGSSIRGAWWASSPGELIELRSCGLWSGGSQLAEAIQFTPEEWASFIRAVLLFSAPEMIGTQGAGFEALPNL
ncbi:hypothetical protein [Delftia acidovorans]|uniref:hypothetical protein n=1 Tax=Delftia acidovorans TaxID=80866 RepID=UPI003D1068C6